MGASGGKSKGPPPAVKKLLGLFGSQREEDRMVGYLSFLKIGPKLLKFLPGTAPVLQPVCCIWGAEPVNVMPCTADHQFLYCWTSSQCWTISILKVCQRSDCHVRPWGNAVSLLLLVLSDCTCSIAESYRRPVGWMLCTIKTVLNSWAC